MARTTRRHTSSAAAGATATLAVAAWSLFTAAASDAAAGCDRGGACPGDSEADVSELYQLRLQRDTSGSEGGVGSEGAEAAVAARKISVIDRAFADIQDDSGDRAAAGQGPIQPSPAQYIDERFKGINGIGHEWPTENKVDNTWQECGGVNWTKVAMTPKDGKLKLWAVDRMMRELNLTVCYNQTDSKYHDPTCAAVRVVISASIDMEAMFPEGPKFANASVVAWGKFPSWVFDSVSGVDYSRRLPLQAKLVNGNAVLGYGLCDMIRTVLTSSANQKFTATCGWVAGLAALSHKAPALTLKVAMRLLWAGEITPSLGPACPAIFEQQPGLIPFLDARGNWVPDFYPGGAAAVCAGNDVDCIVARGKPVNPPGLTHMWSQSLISKFMEYQYGECDPTRARAGLIYPGQSPAEKQAVTQYQGFRANALMWLCNTVIDPVGKTCALLVNPKTCQNVPYDLCVQKMATDPMPKIIGFISDIQTEFMGEAFSKGYVTHHSQTLYMLPKLIAAVANRSHASRSQELVNYVKLVATISMSTRRSFTEVMNNFKYPFYPSFTEELLNRTCSAHVALFFMDAHVLSWISAMPDQARFFKAQKMPFYGNYREDGQVKAISPGCDHGVYLEKCDFENNNFVFWTWGKSMNLTKEMLLGYPALPRKLPSGWRMPADTYNTGVVCYAVVADQITLD